MNENPWDIKRKIDACISFADQLGFELREKSGDTFGPDGLYLYAKKDSIVYNSTIALRKFNSWHECMDYLDAFDRGQQAQRIYDVRVKGKAK